MWCCVFSVDCQWRMSVERRNMEENSILSHRLLLWRQQSSVAYIVLDGWWMSKLVFFPQHILFIKSFDVVHDVPVINTSWSNIKFIESLSWSLNKMHSCTLFIITNSIIVIRHHNIIWGIPMILVRNRRVVVGIVSDWRYGMCTLLLVWEPPAWVRFWRSLAPSWSSSLFAKQVPSPPLCQL